MAHEKEVAMAKEGRDAMLGRPPLVPMSHALDFIDGKKRVAAPEIFTENPRVPERPATAPAFQPVSEAPWKPSKAPSSGAQATFNKFPKYMEDPAHLKLQAYREEAAK